MAATIDYSDVPSISPDALMVMMERLIEAGRGLAVIGGISDHDLRGIERAAWEDMKGTPAMKLAALLRFRSLIAVFAGARLRELFLRRGLAMMVPAMDVAAGMRLNVQWGFSAVKFRRELEARVSDMDQRSAALRVVRTAELQVGLA